MRKLTDFFKKLRVVQILTAFLAGVLMLTSTACNAGDATGARPINPPVQAGGQNNPHKGAGDNSSNFKMSTDPKVNAPVKSDRDRADLPQLDRLIAVSNSESNASRLIYPGSEPLETDKFDKELGGDQSLLKAPQVPAKSQPVFNRTDPDAKLLERAGAVFKDASQFITEGVEESSSGAEMQPKSPIMGGLEKLTGNSKNTSSSNASKNSISNSSRLLYPGSEPLETDKFDKELGGDSSLLQAPQIPAKSQPVFNRTNPDAKLLERAGAVFKDASQFITEGVEESSSGAEMQPKSPVMSAIENLTGNSSTPTKSAPKEYKSPADTSTGNSSTSHSSNSTKSAPKEKEYKSPAR
ncbi:DUF6658 family protein [Microcoleus sp. FACHB-672]|uniref:DUF6658 family protein n=1 Tax=Microcoleus sp. FACHB-672 TaxID=2692825 RepID=UPI001681CA3C|nr:DUF6658 family protein [Microcoleus sp. FACHB-672]MBD2039937.1 hypothetical protein [Microcoleus sp. FACHB-672]